MRPMIAAVVMVVACAGPARAQATFGNVQPGGLPVVFVTDRAGHEMQGKLVQFTETSLTLAVDGSQRTFGVDDVSLVERRGDSLKNGALTGLGVGLGLGALSIGLSDCPGGDHSCPAARVGWLALNTAIYTAIGTAIDAAVTGRTRIWPAKGTSAGAPVAFVSPAARRVFVGWRIRR